MRVGSEQSGGMETGEGGIQNSLEGWKEVRVGSEQFLVRETSEGGLRTKWKKGNSEGLRIVRND